ncbi:MAG: IS6 family transposase [Cyanobacteria bacterium P01_A01_bin.17]
MNISYKRHRFPAEIISYCVWLYYTFPLSFRDIQKKMAYRGIEVTYEAIRKWCRKFAQAYANQIRRCRSKPADKWHLDEVVIKTKGKKYYLWRAVDKYGQVIDILMQSRRNEAAADKFFRKLLKPQEHPPRVLITDKPKSYGAAKKKILKGVDHRQHKGLNNRAENSHRPTRVRERRVGRFKSPGHAQRFLSALEPIRGHFHPFQHQLPATEFREVMSQRFESWREITRLNAAA